MVNEHKKDNRGRKTNESKGLPKKKGRSVYLTDKENNAIVKKHGGLTAAILTTIPKNKKV